MKEQTNKGMGMNRAYRLATREEHEKWGGDEYSLLLGPGGFECFLGEPEDCTWYRDGRGVVDELNRLHDENEQLQAAIAKATP